MMLNVRMKAPKELCEYLDAGEAALLAVAVNAVATDIDAALTRATKKDSRAYDKGDLDSAVADLEKGLDKAANIAGE